MAAKPKSKGQGKSTGKKPAKAAPKAKPKMKASAKAKPRAKEKKPAPKSAKANSKKSKPAPAKKKVAAKPAPVGKAQKSPGAPRGYRSVTPYLCVDGAEKAIEFYVAAFGAREVMKLRMPDGRICHSEIQIGDSMLMVSDDFPEMNGGKSRSPLKLGGSPVTVHVYVANVDKSFERAIAAGCSVLMPLMDMFWGDRFGCLVDPFGHMWSMATNQKEMTPAEIEKSMGEFMSQQGSCAGAPEPSTSG